MYIKVEVQLGAKKEILQAVSKDHYIVSVKEKAERNAANKRVLELLSAFLGVSAGDVRIVTGHHSRKKILDINV